MTMLLSLSFTRHAWIVHTNITVISHNEGKQNTNDYVIKPVTTPSHSDYTAVSGHTHGKENTNDHVNSNYSTMLKT